MDVQTSTCLFEMVRQGITECHFSYLYCFCYDFAQMEVSLASKVSKHHFGILSFFLKAQKNRENFRPSPKHTAGRSGIVMGYMSNRLIGRVI